MSTPRRPYVTDMPARRDLTFRTNDDKLVGVVWLASDGVTPVEIVNAMMTLVCDVPPVYPAHPITPSEPFVPTRHIIETTDPSDPGGFIDADGLLLGQVLVLVPSGVWATIDERSGNWDIVALSATAVRRCLVRGIFIVEEGVST